MFRDLTCLSLLAVLLAPQVGPAQTRTEQEMEDLAKSVKKWLVGRDETAVGLEALVCSDKMPANGGPGLAHHLGVALEAQGVKVDPKAKFTLAGSYAARNDKERRRPVVQVKVEALDEKKMPVKDFKQNVYGERALLDVIAPTVVLDPAADDIDREEAVVKRIVKPEAHLNGSRVSAARESSYLVEVLVKKGKELEPVKARLEGGMPYVTLERDDVYTVRLVNNTPNEAAANLLIDGLHVFSFNEEKDKGGKPIQAQFLVPAKGSIVIRGWPITPKRSDEFLVTEYAKSAAATMKADKSKLGVITAQFAAAWKKGDKPPAGEPVWAKSALGTGRGASIDTPFTAVERSYGAIREQVSIRYLR